MRFPSWVPEAPLGHWSRQAEVFSPRAAQVQSNWEGYDAQIPDQLMG